MAAASAVTSYVTAQGPIKVEYVSATFTSSTDTYVSKLVRPLFVLAAKNGSGTAQTTTSISGKTITVTDAGISSTVVNMLIIGF